MYTVVLPGERKTDSFRLLLTVLVHPIDGAVLFLELVQLSAVPNPQEPLGWNLSHPTHIERDVRWTRRTATSHPPLLSTSSEVPIHRRH